MVEKLMYQNQQMALKLSEKQKNTTVFEYEIEDDFEVKEGGKNEKIKEVNEKI